MVRTVRRTQSISEAQRQDQFQAGEEEICSVPTQTKNGQDLHEEENQNDVTGGKLWEETQREVLGAKTNLFQLKCKIPNGNGKKSFKGRAPSEYPPFPPSTTLTSMSSLRTHAWLAWGPERVRSAREAGLTEETQGSYGGEQEPAEGSLLCSDLCRTCQKVHLWRESKISAETNEKAIFPTRLEYLKSCSKPKWHNHVSIQLGPDIKYWHDQRNHQQLKQKKRTCKDKAKNRLSVNLSFFVFNLSPPNKLSHGYSKCIENAEKKLNSPPL